MVPEKPAPKPKKLDEDGNEVEEEGGEEAEEDPEEAAKKYAPKFQQHIYPDSVIMLRADDDFLRRKAEGLTKERNKKWDAENLERRLMDYRARNDVSLFQ